MLKGNPFRFAGTNAYYLMVAAARGDSSAVRDVLVQARSLNMSVVRTWAFHDSPDSLNPTVIQYRPGAYNESALRALDFVVHEAAEHNIRVILTLVNSWDDFGGMNQYVRWRSASAPHDGKPEMERYTTAEQERTVIGQQGRSYRVALSGGFGHDDFYRDPVIRRWFQDYCAAVVNRVNTRTGRRYRDEPAILGWELANEPRSSDRSGMLVNTWMAEMSSFLKGIDTAHLVSTGEEGFDTSPGGYTTSLYSHQSWLFDGTSGVSFRLNSALPCVDLASIHLYPEFWNIPAGSGNAWISDHTALASRLTKPLLLGEFGVRTSRAATYSSWMTTARLQGAAGALVWQLLDHNRFDPEGFGIRCPDDQEVCDVLATEAAAMMLPPGSNEILPELVVRQNYPNPFNGVTTIEYQLPSDARVVLSVWNTLGQRVSTLVEGVQTAGLRKELLDAHSLATGVYFYRLLYEPLDSPGRKVYSESRGLVILK
ncbi:MAG: cellulase family glycosylhydrolase [Ignavibacteria bacterium]|nr:cellulase family glycosylhydrolase [Ignavibacteria bacterium]